MSAEKHGVRSWQWPEPLGDARRSRRSVSATRVWDDPSRLVSAAKRSTPVPEGSEAVDSDRWQRIANTGEEQQQHKGRRPGPSPAARLRHIRRNRQTTSRGVVERLTVAIAGPTLRRAPGQADQQRALCGKSAGG